MQKFKKWIGGEWEEGVSGETCRILNLGNGGGITEVPIGGEADVDKAVRTAAKTFPVWSTTPQAERFRLRAGIAASQYA